MNLLAIVPARGGSVGVPHKNLRLVSGKPMVVLLLDKLSRVHGITRIVCTTDSPTIAALCRIHGYEAITRPPELATDDATVQQVAAWVVEHLEWTGPVVVCQPTSPTLSLATLQAATDEFLTTPHYDSMELVTAESHILRDNAGRPLFADYANRQSLTPNWRPTGGAMFARTVPADGGPFPSAPLIGGIHHLYEVTPGEAIDIDTPADLLAARRYLAAAQTIDFYTMAYAAIGSGHLRRCLQLAQELDHYTIRFVLPVDTPQWAVDLCAPYEVSYEPTYPPNLAIIDRLDTSVEQVAYLRARGTAVVCLEDLGPGSDMADFVINELYDDPRPNALCGPRYAVLRPEFSSLPRYTVRDLGTSGYRVLVAFGGTDPSNLAARIAPIVSREAHCSVLQSPAAEPYAPGSGIRVLDGDGTVAEHMMCHDLLICSAGRMAHEAAAVGIPTITLAANERESRHAHCPGILRLGLAVTVPSDTIQESVYRVLHSPGLRQEMSDTARAAIDGKGGQRIAHLAEGLLEGL